MEPTATNLDGQVADDGDGSIMSTQKGFGDDDQSEGAAIWDDMDSVVNIVLASLAAIILCLAVYSISFLVKLRRKKRRKKQEGIACDAGHRTAMWLICCVYIDCVYIQKCSVR